MPLPPNHQRKGTLFAMKRSSNGPQNQPTMFCSGDAVFFVIYPESAISIATSKRIVVPVGIQRIPLDEKRRVSLSSPRIVASDLALGGTGNELGDDLFVCHGEQILI